MKPLFALLLFIGTAYAAGQVTHFDLAELRTQAYVGTQKFGAQEDQEWVDQCLNLDLDMQKLGCKIVAYRIQWFFGGWSPWYVPGVNDLYKKPGETLRRYWACFNDHNFEIIYHSSKGPLLFPSADKREKNDEGQSAE